MKAGIGVGISWPGDASKTCRDIEVKKTLLRAPPACHEDSSPEVPLIVLRCVKIETKEAGAS